MTAPKLEVPTELRELTKRAIANVAEQMKKFTADVFTSVKNEFEK